MKIISWNVNGIRSVTNKGFIDFIEQESPDILCLQEIKALPEQFPREILELRKYNLQIKSAEKKGYSGVATFSSEKFLDTDYLGVDEFDSEGRTLIHETKDFYLFNCYIPNGSRDHHRVPYKMKFCEALEKKMNQLQKKKPVILVGDINTAHTEIDLANPKTNQKTTGFLPEERAWVSHMLQSGWLDIYRDLHPEKKGAYTWWSQRAGVREKNIGWRIDYFLLSTILKSSVRRVDILKDVYGSDHCPIVLELD